MARWKQYPYNPRYYVSTDGEVMRKNKDPRAKRFKKLKPVPRDGYLFVSIGKDVQKPIHALVLETFDRPKRRREVCRHLDGISTNNRLSNLKWGTHQENEDDKLQHGTRVHGEIHYLAKLTNEQVLRIFTSNLSLKRLADKYATDIRQIRSIKERRSYALVTKDHIAGETYMGKPSGHEHGRSELTKVEARKIMIATGSYDEIAERFGTSKHIVGAIKRKDRYADATAGLHPPIRTRRNIRRAA